jgi:hypothetical protein
MTDRKTLLVVTLATLAVGLGGATLTSGEPVRYDETTMSEPKVIHKVAPQKSCSSFRRRGEQAAGAPDEDAAVLRSCGARRRGGRRAPRTRGKATRLR